MPLADEKEGTNCLDMTVVDNEDVSPIPESLIGE